MKWYFHVLLIITVSLLCIGCNGPSSTPTAYGTLERERILLTALGDKILLKTLVNEGDLVKKGQLLATLDASREQFQIEEATGNLRAAEARLTKLENGARKEDVSAARAKLLVAEANLELQKKSYSRIKKLVDKGDEPESSLDSVKAAYDSAQASYQDLREQLLKLTNGSRPEDILEASAQVDAAKARINIAQTQYDDLQIKATRDGKVEALPWNIGERVTAGSPVVVLLSGVAPFVRTYIPQAERAKIHVGDSVQIHLDGVTESVTGTVSKIATQPSFTPYYALNASDRSRLVYLAEIQLDDKYAKLPSGLPAEVQLP